MYVWVDLQVLSWMPRKSLDIAMHSKSETSISPHDISALNVWLFSLKNQDKVNVTV